MRNSPVISNRESLDRSIDPLDMKITKEKKLEYVINKADIDLQKANNVQVAS